MDWRAANAAVFENYIAASLLRTTALLTDRFGDKMTLHFVRTHDGTEIDFLICRNDQPWLLIEAKQGVPEISRAAYRFADELGVPCVIVTAAKNTYKKIVGPRRQKIYAISWAKLGQVLA
jgi:hypothetical protein